MEGDLFPFFTSQQSTRALVQIELYNDQYLISMKNKRPSVDVIVDLDTVSDSDGEILMDMSFSGQYIVVWSQQTLWYNHTLNFGLSGLFTFRSV